MKRLVYLLMLLCMLVPCLAAAELVEDDMFFTDEEIFSAVPDEPVQEPVDEDTIVPVENNMMVIPTTGVNGPDPYRELVLLKPTALTLAKQSETVVRIAWEPVPFATQYDVLQKIQGESDYTTIKSIPSGQLYFDATVETGKIIYFRVRAINTSYDENDNEVITESPDSPTATYISLAKPDVADPRGLDADTLRLNWSAVPGVGTYEVEMSQNPGIGFSVVRNGLTTTHCNVDNLSNKQGYYFRVRAVRAISSGEKYYSEYSSPIKCGTPMDRPVLSVGNSASGAVLSWTASTGAEKYVIYRKEGVSGSYAKLTITADDATTYTDTTVTAGEVYYYYVYGMRKVGVYNCFSLSSVNTAYCAVEGAVINSVENTGDLEQTIHWTGPSGSGGSKGANKYLVYSSTSEDGLYTQIGETTETSFVATGLESGKTYSYKVLAIREFNNGDRVEGPWSNIMTMPEAGVLQISSVTATNSTAGVDVSGGYVGDTMLWNTTVSGGSGAYTFRYALVGLNGGGYILLKDFTDGYTALPVGQSSLTVQYGITLTTDMCDLISSQAYAMQVEVMDSNGNIVIHEASEATYAEMNFCAPKPVSQTVNITLRAGETLDLAHGIFTEAGDTALLDVSNPTGAISMTGNTVTAVSSGYASILITPERYKNDVLIVYNITVGYATLAINSVTPSATTIKNYETLA